MPAPSGGTLDGADLGTLGAFLSGGIDSTTVVGLLSRQTSVAIPAFSIGFAEKGYDEMDFARISAAHYGLRHVSYYVTPADIVDSAPRIAAAYDEPFGNASAIPVYYCAKLAAENGIKTMLAGDGGGEIFAGNPHYASQKLFERYQRVPAVIRRALLEPVIGAIPGGDSISLLRKARGCIRKANIPLPRRLHIDNAYEGCDPAAIFAPDAARAIDPRHPMALLDEVYQRTASADPVQQLLHLDQQIILADNDLRKVGRMCELAGVDVRFPLLDEDVCALSAAIPPEIALKGTNLRWFYKEAFKDFLPRQTIDKGKHGFSLPFVQWLRTSPVFRDFTYAALEPLKRRGIIRNDFIDRAVKLHAEGHAAFHGATVWDLMMLSCWLDAHTGGAATAAKRTAPPPLTPPSRISGRRSPPRSFRPAPPAPPRYARRSSAGQSGRRPAFPTT